MSRQLFNLIGSFALVILASISLGIAHYRDKNLGGLDIAGGVFMVFGIIGGLVGFVATCVNWSDFAATLH